MQYPSHATTPAQRASVPKTRVAWYVLSSHWDREWYRSFQVFRAQLAELVDDVLDLYESGDATGPFYCDGQAIVLEDYLEVRPERRDLLLKALQDGAIVAGPWYNLPDEFLVSGESLIRNIRRGRDLVRSLGTEPSNTGFLCDLFGHNSQMPQLFRGFGIKGGFLWRGVNAHTVRHVRWQGADGTELPCYRFGTNGYWGVAVHVTNFTDHAGKLELTPDAIEERLTKFLIDEAERTEIEDVLLFHGPDHLQINPEFEAAWREILTNHDDERFVLRHGSLDDYQTTMLAQKNRIKTVVEGELIEPGRESIDIEQQWLTGGTLASRIWIKQENCRAQATLCHWAEPWNWAAQRIGLRTAAPGFLDRAWKYLLQNHPHDSICGCSIDAVHRDMAYRFRQCLDLAGVVTDTATHGFARAISLEQAPEEHRVVVFNPLPRGTNDVVELELEVPSNWPRPERFGNKSEPYVNLRLLDAEGDALPFQRLGQHVGLVRVDKRRNHSPDKGFTDRVRLAVRADLPALGYTTLRVAPAKSTDVAQGDHSGPALATDVRTLRNELLTVTVETDGTLCLTDHRTGQVYRNLLNFENRGDIGDGWTFEPPVNDQAYVSNGSRHQVSLVEDGPLQATLRLRTEFSVPSEFDRHRQQRSERLETLVIDTRIMLRAGAERVDVRCRVENNVRDHRLRVQFPTGCEADTYLADTPFDVVERAIALRENNAEYRDRELETKPQQSWCSVHRGQRGLAVVAAGLMESAVRDLPDRPIALTLLRATQRTVFTNGEPDGQLQGPLDFDFSIVPLTGEPDRVFLTELGQHLNACGRYVQLHPADLGEPPPAVALPPRDGYFAVEGPVVVSSIRVEGDAMEVRLFNPQTTDADCKLRLSSNAPASKQAWLAQRVDFESTPLGKPIDASAGLIALSLAPKQIVTLQVSHDAR